MERQILKAVEYGKLHSRKNNIIEFYQIPGIDFILSIPGIFYSILFLNCKPIIKN